MHIYYSDTFILPLPSGHRFPMAKYALLRQRVQASGLLPTECITEPIGATDEQLLRVHDPAYLDRVKTGTLSTLEIRRIGFPWSLGMVERSRRSVGGTLGAARSALTYGAGVNLAGGTHHAGYDYGSGFCVFNDVVVAARTMQHEGLAGHILIVDADVHQGEGTAILCDGDPTIFTYSIHGEKNFPFRKHPSDLDIGLPDGTRDDDYLAQFELGLLRALSMAHADMVFYIAGADPYAADRLGRLSVSKAGLAARDRLLFDACGSMNLPVATVMGGGYSNNLDDIVEIHFATVAQAVNYGSERA